MPVKTGGPDTGIWRASRGLYTLGALLAAILSVVVGLGLLWPPPDGSATAMAQAVLVFGAGMVAAFAPLGAWIAWYANLPGRSAPKRWLSLTLVASVVSGLTLAVALGTLHVIELWPILAAAIAAIHAAWTALFLLGSRR